MDHVRLSITLFGILSNVVPFPVKRPAILSNVVPFPAKCLAILAPNVLGFFYQISCDFLTKHPATSFLPNVQGFYYQPNTLQFIAAGVLQFYLYLQTFNNYLDKVS